MKQNEAVYKIMSTDIVSCKPIDKFSTIKSILNTNGVRHVPVLEGKKLVGIISRIDVLKASYSNTYATEGGDDIDLALDQSITAANIMTKKVTTLKENDTIKSAARILATSSFHSVPVVNANNELVGMISTADLIQFLLDQY